MAIEKLSIKYDRARYKYARFNSLRYWLQSKAISLRAERETLTGEPLLWMHLLFNDTSFRRLHLHLF